MIMILICVIGGVALGGMIYLTVKWSKDEDVGGEDVKQS